jgi:surfactin synthase thioesterase subunit
MAPDTTATLFCIPHAGGSAAHYTQLRSFLPDTLRLRPLELPGRGRRHNEPLHTSMSTLCNDLLDAIRPEAEAAPYAIFGHSMGGLLAFLCAMRAAERNIPLPRRLFLSATATPESPRFMPDITGLPCAQPSFEELSPEQLWEHVVEMGGIPQCVASSDEFRSYLMPVLHADFTAVTSWKPQGTIKPIPVPITVFLGEEDFLTKEKAAEWQSLTTVDFSLHLFPGNHFYLQENWAGLADCITQRLGQR